MAEIRVKGKATGRRALKSSTDPAWSSLPGLGSIAALVVDVFLY
jgi:hypothetical protein